MARLPLSSATTEVALQVMLRYSVSNEVVMMRKSITGATGTSPTHQMERAMMVALQPGRYIPYVENSWFVKGA